MEQKWNILSFGLGSPVLTSSESCKESDSMEISKTSSLAFHFLLLCCCRWSVRPTFDLLSGTIVSAGFHSHCEVSVGDFSQMHYKHSANKVMNTLQPSLKRTELQGVKISLML